MAHEITIRADNFAEMAFKGALPWHKLGNRMVAGASIDEWRKAGGLDFDVLRYPVYFDGMEYPDREVLCRSDNKHPLGIVSPKFKIVQPEEVCDFFVDQINANGFEMETMGTLKGGELIWALANTGAAASIGGSRDMLKGYALLVTGTNGKHSTMAFPTTIRGVCANTIKLAISSADSMVRVTHASVFDAEKVKAQLGYTKNAFADFMLRLNRLANKPLNLEEAESVLVKILPKSDGSDPRKQRSFKKIMALFTGEGLGAEMESAKQTAWGLLNGVTEFVDHHQSPTRADDVKMFGALFGPGHALKHKALEILETV